MANPPGGTGEAGADASERVPRQNQSADNAESFRQLAVSGQQEATTEYLSQMQFQRKHSPATALSLGFLPFKENGSNQVTGFQIVFAKNDEARCSTSDNGFSDPLHGKVQRDLVEADELMSKGAWASGDNRSSGPLHGKVQRDLVEADELMSKGAWASGDNRSSGPLHGKVQRNLVEADELMSKGAWASGDNRSSSPPHGKVQGDLVETDELMSQGARATSDKPLSGPLKLQPAMVDADELMSNSRRSSEAELTDLQLNKQQDSRHAIEGSMLVGGVAISIEESNFALHETGSTANTANETARDHSMDAADPAHELLHAITDADRHRLDPAQERLRRIAAELKSSDMVLGAPEPLLEQPPLPRPVMPERTFSQAPLPQPLAPEPLLEQPPLPRPVMPERTFSQAPLPRPLAPAPLLEQPPLPRPVMPERTFSQAPLPQPLAPEPLLEQPPLPRPVMPERTFSQAPLPQPLAPEPLLEQPPLPRPVMPERTFSQAPLPQPLAPEPLLEQPPLPRPVMPERTFSQAPLPQPLAPEPLLEQPPLPRPVMPERTFSQAPLPQPLEFTQARAPQPVKIPSTSSEVQKPRLADVHVSRQVIAAPEPVRAKGAGASPVPIAPSIPAAEHLALPARTSATTGSSLSYLKQSEGQIDRAIPERGAQGSGRVFELSVQERHSANPSTYHSAYDNPAETISRATTTLHPMQGKAESHLLKSKAEHSALRGSAERSGQSIDQHTMSAHYQHSDGRNFFEMDLVLRAGSSKNGPINTIIGGTMKVNGRPCESATHLQGNLVTDGSGTFFTGDIIARVGRDVLFQARGQRIQFKKN